MKRIILFCLVASGQLTSLRAEDSDQRWRREMENKIDLLTQELEKAKLGGVPPGQAAAKAEGNSPVTLAPYSLAPSAAKVYGVDRGFSIGGYGEFVYENFRHSVSDTLNGDENQPRNAEFNLARWVLYIGYKFSDKIFLNSEIEIEGANSAKSGEVGAEFAYLDFALSKPFGLRVGELLLPVGLTNEYHEPVVFQGVLRPDVERYIIPTTWHENGLGYYGQWGPWAYRGCLVAGLRAAENSGMNQDGFQPDIGILEGRQEGSQSRAHDLAYVQRLDYIQIPGWLFGGSIYYGDAGQGDSINGEHIHAPVTLWEAHLRGERKGLQVKALFAQATIGGAATINQANGLSGNQSVGQSLWGGYAEIAYNLFNLTPQFIHQSLSPFFRYERYNTQATAPAGYASDGRNNRTVYTMGLSYKPIPRIALKADYQIRRNTAHTGVDQFNLGAGYEF